MSKVSADRVDLPTEKARILAFISELENEQITCAVATNDLDSSKYSFNYNYSFENLLSTGNKTTVVNSFSDAVYTLSAAVTITVNSDTSQLLRNASASGRIPSAQISFYRYMDAIYNNIRVGGTAFTSRYRDLLIDELQKSFIFSLIYYFCQVALILAAAIILIKHVFDVMNKNKEVMTLFAMIERPEIVKLKDECQVFLHKNIGNLFESDSEESKSEAERQSNLRSLGDADSDEESEVSKDSERRSPHEMSPEDQDRLIRERMLQEKAHADMVPFGYLDPHDGGGKPGFAA